MKLWTIQPIEVWEQLKINGVWRCDPAKSSYSDDEGFQWAYQWMIGRMVEKIAPPPKGVKSPVWAWCRFHGYDQVMPHIRDVRGYVSEGKGVRLELGIDEKRVLLSDFNLWHSVLNYHPILHSCDEYEAFWAEKEMSGLKLDPDNPTFYDRFIQRSWELIFDLSWNEALDWCNDPPREKSVQATFWELHLSDIRKVKEFMGK